MDLDPSKTMADAVMAKGTFKETAENFFSNIEETDKPRQDRPPEKVIGIESIHPRRMTIELLEKYHHLITILDSISEGILEIDHGRITYANPAAITILGKPLDQLLAAYPADLFAEAEKTRIEGIMRSPDSGPTIVSPVGPFKLQNKLLSLKKLPLQGVPDNAILLLSDITEKIQNEEALQNYQAHLEKIIDERTADLNRTMEKLQQSQKMEAMGILAGGVAHDLNNILNPIVVYPELLLFDLPENSPIRPVILSIKESAEKAAAVVQDLLTMARRGVQTYEVVNLNKIITNYLNSPTHLKLMALHTHISLETQYEKDLLNIQGSPVHLSKIIMNLVSNAAEAMPQVGKVFLTTKTCYLDRPIKINSNDEEVKEGEYVILTVADEGVGISSEDMPKIFEPFYTKKKMGRSGTGLGMTVVWGAVKDHQGHIEAQSNQGKGTVFRLYFPVTRQELNHTQTSVPLEKFKGKGETILVVDDVKEQRDMVSLAFSAIGYSVSTVSSGEEAVAFLKNKPMDLVVLDMIMDPGIDGLETYKRIRTFSPEQRVIIASGYSEADLIAECLRLGVRQFINKPYTLEKLGLALRQELDNSPL
jgi:signal transduction histidine kinase/CheY-like chemotaxis protein